MLCVVDLSQTRMHLLRNDQRTCMVYANCMGMGSFGKLVSVFKLSKFGDSCL